MQNKFVAVINQKLIYMAKIGMGGEHHKYYKHAKFQEVASNFDHEMTHI